MNVVSRRDVADHHGGLVCLDCAEMGEFRMHTAETLSFDIARAFACLADFEANKITKGHAVDVIKALGYEPSAYGVWSDPQVAGIASPVDVLNFDCPHIFVSDGLLVHEMQAFVDSSDGSLGERYRSFAFLEWKAPGCNGPLKASHVILRCLEKSSFGGHTRPSSSDI